MKFAQEFQVGRPLPEVWALFQDVPAVAQCMPGAELTADKGGGVFAGLVSVKLGPLNPTFEGEATAIYDDAAKEIQLTGSGVDRTGGSRGRVNVEVGLRDVESATVVAVDANITLSGAASRFGRTGLMEEMANRLINEFVACLEAKLAAGTEAEAASVQAREVRGLSLFLSSIAGWLSRLFRRLFGTK
ncbi:MAG: SRPBCC family protein [Acidimicrobiia bacterium]|nr:SRPBCC family protein [Acidimicrobiia bacterium]